MSTTLDCKDDYKIRDWGQLSISLYQFLHLKLKYMLTFISFGLDHGNNKNNSGKCEKIWLFFIVDVYSDITQYAVMKSYIFWCYGYPPPCIKFYYVGGILEIMYSSSIHPNLYSLDTLQNVNLYFYTYPILVNIKKIVL